MKSTRCASPVIFLLFAFTLTALPAEESLSLAGKWSFSRDEAKAGMKEKWYEGALKTVGDGPTEVSLPGTTDEAKAGKPNPQPPSYQGLYRPNVYEGRAWYQREIDIPTAWQGKHITLFLERNHWTVHVWLDGKDVGTQDTLIAPQIYDLGTSVTPGKHRLTICVDNTVKIDLGHFVSINYEYTQTNWNGIIGAIELRASDPVALGDVEVYPDVDRKLIKVEVRIDNVTGAPAQGTLQFVVTDEAGADIGTPLAVPFSVTSAADSVVTAEVPMGASPKLWDEFSPHLYSLKTSLAAKSFHSEKSVSFGMRKLAVQGTQFTMNGRPLFLRGTLECCIFPLTGYPPTDVASWRRIYRIEKSYGLNFIRFHSWCPPDAAFTAADEEGIMIQAEAPCANSDPKEKTPMATFLPQEMMRIVRTYGNHPSFCLMALGNEYRGSEELKTQWVDMLIKADSRHLYSSPTSYSTTPNRQWTEEGTGRGIHGPGTADNAHAAVDGHDRPTVGHEIGQWTFYPNLDEIKKYTGVVQAKNFEMVRDGLKEKGLLDQAPHYFENTGKHAVLLYKEEIENLLRTPGYAGFSLLDLHDYPGQGTALVGLLDPFWDSKGFITPEEHKRYCGPTVPLLRFPKRAYTTGESFNAAAEISQFGPADLAQVEPEWQITDEKGTTIASGVLEKVDLPTGKLGEIGKISVPLAGVTAPVKLTVTLSLKGTDFRNAWDIWVYPNASAPSPPADVRVTDVWDDAAKKALADGGRVVLFPARYDTTKTLKGTFLPVFWSPVWFPRGPSTMGILCDPHHPALSLFPTGPFSDWQWWDLIEHSRTLDLSSTPPDFQPIVQVIDNFSRQKKLGNLFEARVGPGSLLVCTIDLQKKLAGNPAAAQLLRSLYAYVGSNAFHPRSELAVSFLDELLTPPAPLHAEVVSFDSAAPAHPAINAIDGDPDTFWHTAWQPSVAPLPHAIVLDLGAATAIKGITCLARQDMENGRTKDCEVYLSDDATNWSTTPTATAQLKDTGELQTISFPASATGRYLKFVVKSVYGNQPLSVIAELNIMR